MKLIESEKRHADKTIQGSKVMETDRLSATVATMKRDNKTLKASLEGERKHGQRLQAQVDDLLQEKSAMQSTVCHCSHDSPVVNVCLPATLHRGMICAWRNVEHSLLTLPHPTTHGAISALCSLKALIKRHGGCWRSSLQLKDKFSTCKSKWSTQPPPLAEQMLQQSHTVPPLGKWLLLKPISW
jgi:hypothetical protein